MPSVNIVKSDLKRVGWFREVKNDEKCDPVSYYFNGQAKPEKDEGLYNAVKKDLKWVKWLGGV
jgi:hypothetical protein